MTIARNTIYNLLGSSVPLALSVVVLPLYVHVIGLERYGILAICWLILAYFGLFDFGFGRAAAKRIAMLGNDPSRDAERSATFWTALLLTLTAGLVATAICLPAAYLALAATKVADVALQRESYAAVPWLAALVPFALLNGILFGAMEGRERFAATNAINSAGSVLSALLPLGIAVWISPALPLMVAAALLARMLAFFVLFAVAVPQVPIGRPAWPQRAIVIELIGYGGWVTVSNIVGPLLSLWDRFAIGIVLGAAAVSLYVVPFNIVSQASLLPIALSTAIFPRMAAASGERSRELAIAALAMLACIMTPVSVLLIAFAEPGLRLLLNAEIARLSGPVAALLVIGIWTNAMARVPFVMLQATGRPDLTAKVHLAEVVPYALALYFGMHWFGIAGAALAWSGRCAFDWLVMSALARLPLGPYPMLRRSAALLAAATTTALLLPWDSAERITLMAVLAILAGAMALRQMPWAMVEQLRANRRVPARIAAFFERMNVNRMLVP